LLLFDREDLQIAPRKHTNYGNTKTRVDWTLASENNALTQSRERSH